jgi:hypothetical protein
MPNDVAQPPAKQAPAHLAAPAPGRVEKDIRHFLKVMGASTGHRGRVEARGQRRHGAPGLTRISGQAVGVPSRDGRSAAPAALRGLNCSPASITGTACWRPWIAATDGRAAHMPSSATPKASCLVEHEKERRQLGPKFASGPAPRQPVGRGLRRGLDGPSMPPLLLKNGECLSPPAQVSPRQGGQGLVSQAVAPRRWASSARIRRFRARSAHAARTSFIERPRKSRPSRPDFRWPHAGETSPCPPCRRQASGQREAHHADHLKTDTQSLRRLLATA